MSASSRKSSGFTLIEMLVTVVILVILLTIGVTSFRGIILNQRIKSASFDLFSALEQTRSEAIKRNASVTLKAGAASDGAWVTGWRLLDASSNILRSWSATSNVTITEAGGATTVTFARDGHLTTAAPKLEISPETSLNGVTSRCIQVSLNGRPSTQKGSCP